MKINNGIYSVNFHKIEIKHLVYASQDALIMVTKLTDFEKSVFCSAWLAWKDITQLDFLKTFKPIWIEMSKEIERLCEQCGYPVRLKGSRIAFTLQPHRSLAFSPIANGYMINIWHLLFRNNRQIIYFNPLEFLACGFVHEENHRKFFESHDMLGHNKETDNFMNKFYFELEEKAISEEIEFLKKAKNIIPKIIHSRSFIINSWSDTGLPYCEITEIEVLPPIRLEFYLLERKNVLEQLKFFANKMSNDKCKKMNEAYENGMYSNLSIALKLSKPSQTSPIIELTYSSPDTHHEQKI